MDKPKNEICTIRIMFPVDTDEQAIDIKKKAAALLVEMPESHLSFSITTGLPTNPLKP